MLRQTDRFFLCTGQHDGQRSWRGIGLLAATYGGAILFAALAAPPVYIFFQQLAEWAPSAFTDYMAGHAFHRFFDRLRWLPVLITLPWLFRQCGLDSRRRLGLYWDSDGKQRFLQFFTMGAIMLALIALLQFLLTPVSHGGPWFLSEVLRIGAGATASALIIALLEEILFRGLVFRLFYTALPVIPALLASTLFFTVVHFKHTDLPANMEVSAWSGFVVAWEVVIIAPLSAPPLVFINLLLVGLILHLVFLRTRNLMAPIGLHAGWIFFRDVYSGLFTADTSAPLAIFGTTRLIDGALAAALLLLFSLLYLTYANLASNTGQSPT